MKYDQDIVERIRNISIADMIGVQLHSRYKMIQCPFHPDDTPSFKLNDNNSFYCFGCGVKGNNFIDYLILKGYQFSQIYDEFKDNVIHSHK